MTSIVDTRIAEPHVMAGDVPPVGAWPNIDPSLYHRWAAASNSRLSKLQRSPLHLLQYLAEPFDTSSLAIGRALHCAVLEPDEFPKRYGMAPASLDRRTKEGKAAWEHLLNRFGEGYVLKSDAFEDVVRMCQSIAANPTAMAILDALTARELSIAWDAPYWNGRRGVNTMNGISPFDADGLVRAKARFDGYAPELDGGTIVDIKSTKDASPDAFAKAIYTYGYHRQGGHYTDGGEAIGLRARHYVIIAVENAPPYATAVYRITGGALEAGRDQVNRLLGIYDRCTTSGIFPGYPEHVQDITLPDFAWSQIDREIQQ